MGTTVTNHVASSEVSRNLAEARLAQMKADQASLSLETEKHKQDFNETQDYRHGRCVFMADIDLDTAVQLTTTLRRMARLHPPGTPLTVELCSRGGDVVAGLAAYDELVAIGRGNPLTILVRGQAASMAAVLLQAASHRIMGKHARLMLHKTILGDVEGESDHVQDVLDEARSFEETMYNILASRTHKDKAYWKRRLGKRKDVYFEAPECLELGLIDEIA